MGTTDEGGSVCLAGGTARTGFDQLKAAIADGGVAGKTSRYGLYAAAADRGIGRNAAVSNALNSTAVDRGISRSAREIERETRFDRTDETGDPPECAYQSLPAGPNALTLASIALMALEFKEDPKPLNTRNSEDEKTN